MTINDAHDCPFCVGKPYIHMRAPSTTSYEQRDHQVACDGCGLAGPGCAGISTAVEKWNELVEAVLSHTKYEVVL